jgi:hypothetical protein
LIQDFRAMAHALSNMSLLLSRIPMPNESYRILQEGDAELAERLLALGAAIRGGEVPDTEKAVLERLFRGNAD